MSTILQVYFLSEFAIFNILNKKRNATLSLTSDSEQNTEYIFTFFHLMNDLSVSDFDMTNHLHVF